MQDWTRGYVSDVGYLHGFYEEMAPGHIGMVMLMKGDVAPDFTAPFTYCELGCGQGLTTNLLAAANPHGQFWATDFLPAHALNAARLAQEAGTTNIRFFDNDFMAMAEEDLPQFDMIALHGVYSWVSPETRQAIVAFIARRLKLGGVVYISYNSLPGWAAALPLRQMMIQHTEGDHTLARVANGLAFAKRVMNTNAAYFANNPAVRVRLEEIGKQPANYIAHEYFNRNFHPQYFAEVAGELAAAKLAFSISAHVADNIDAINFSAEMQTILREMADMNAQQGLRDVFANQQFRRDIFVRGQLRIPQPVQAAGVLQIRVALVTLPDSISLTARFLVGEVGLQPEVYRPVIAALGRGPATIATLMADPDVAAVGFAGVLQALGILCGMRHVMAALPAEGDAERRVSTDRFNAAAMQRARLSDEIQYLASPVLGSGIAVSQFAQLFMLAIAQGLEPVPFAWETVRALGQRLVKDGQALETDAQNLEAMQAFWSEFETSRLPVLRQLGVF